MTEAVKIISDNSSAELLKDPMRRLILDLLATGEMTEAELAERLALSEASVNHHLKELKKADLIEVVRTEAESHGILQKFYRSSAMFIILDYTKVPFNIRRYAFVLYLERIRGALAVLRLANPKAEISWGDLETLTDAFAEQVVLVARGIGPRQKNIDKEELILRVYSQALRELAKSKDGGKMRELLESLRL